MNMSTTNEQNDGASKARRVHIETETPASTDNLWSTAGKNGRPPLPAQPDPAFPLPQSTAKPVRKPGRPHNPHHLAAFVRWSGQPSDLRDLFRACGLLVSDRDLLYDWDEINGWIIDRAERERKRAAKNRAREAAEEARKERIAAQRRKVAQSGRKEGRKEGGGGDTRSVRVRNSGPKTRNQKGK
jgi:hypothetical protein